MAELNLQKYGELIKRTLELAHVKEWEYNEEFRGKDPEGKGYYEIELSSIDVDKLAVSDAEKALTEFLEENDYELTKILCIIMWVGRDSSLEAEDGTYDYCEIRRIFDKGGWDQNKSHKIDYLVGKPRLYTYLQAGLEKLNIRL